MVHYPARIGLKELGVYGGELHVSARPPFDEIYPFVKLPARIRAGLPGKVYHILYCAP